MIDREILKQLGWSDELIDAATAVSREVASSLPSITSTVLPPPAQAELLDGSAIDLSHQQSGCIDSDVLLTTSLRDGS